MTQSFPMSLAWRDDWPIMPDGSDFDGEQLLTLVRGGNSPFQGVWDVNLLIQEIEETLGFRVIDIPNVDKGSNYYVSFCFTIFFYLLTQFKMLRPSFLAAVPGLPYQTLESVRNRRPLISW